MERITQVMAISKRWGQKKIRVTWRKGKNKRKIMEGKIKAAPKINWQTLKRKQKTVIYDQVNVSRLIKTESVHKAIGRSIKTLIQKESNGHIGQCRNKEIIICRTWPTEELTWCNHEDGSGSAEKETLNWNDKIEELKLKITNLNGQKEHSLLKSLIRT